VARLRIATRAMLHRRIIRFVISLIY
jgi:hypothetical protein